MAYSFTCDEAEREIQLGVLIRNRYFQDMLKQITVPRFQRLQDANNEYGIKLFFFSLINVDLVNQSIRGIYYNLQDRLWKEGHFSYPDVLYFCGGIPNVLRPKYRQFIDILKMNDCKFLNYIEGFNKWIIYESLVKIADIKPFLPATKLYTGANTLNDMLKIYGTVYIKGCLGQKGEQVIRVKKISAKMYEYRYFKHCLKIGKVNFKNLIRLLSAFYNKNLFIVQQAISLNEIDGRKIDMRAELQRTGNGELIVNGISVRVGQNGSPITIYSSTFRFVDYVTGIGSKINYEKIIIDFLFRIYSAVEDEYGPLGEIGIDFAIDTKGKIWFIECNSHPTKVSLMKTYDEETIRQTFSNTLAYARFLAGGRPA